jgi:hypothetical protein
MRGTDLTPEQIESAKQFAVAISGIQPPDDDRLISMTFGNFVRVVAWYGAMRYEAGQKGINSLEKPGTAFYVPSRENNA